MLGDIMGRRISEEVKRTIVLKALNATNQGRREIAMLQGVGFSSLNKWLKCYKDKENFSVNCVKQGCESIPFSQKFEHLQATYGLDETSLGGYCRTHGIFSYQLAQWKEEIMKQGSEPKRPKHLDELKALREENKLLRREIYRKEKALAETAALLVLKKKMALILEENEDDR